MRALLLALAIVIAARGNARAVPRLDRFDVGEPVEPCADGKLLSDVTTCLEGIGKVTIAYQTTSVVVVRVTPRADVARLHLYAKRLDGSGWFRSNLNAYMPERETELLAIGAFDVPTGKAVRVVVGSVTNTSVTLDQTTTTPGRVRVVTTTVCVPGTWSCTPLNTRCEVYVGGKVYWTFRGEIVWHPSLGLRLRGNPASAGAICRPPPSLLVDEGS